MLCAPRRRTITQSDRRGRASTRFRSMSALEKIQHEYGDGNDRRQEGHDPEWVGPSTGLPGRRHRPEALHGLEAEPAHRVIMALQWLVMLTPHKTSEPSHHNN